MSLEIAEAFVRVRPNMTGFKSETESGVKGAFSGIGKIVGITLGAAAGFEIVKSAVSAAAQVQKSTEVIQNQFGKAGEAVAAFGEKQGVALGSFSTNTLQTSAKLSFLFKSLGFGTGEAAKMTIGWEKLALAQNAALGGGPSGALGLLAKIPQATRGSARSLLQLGLGFNQAQIQAYEFAHSAQTGVMSITQALTPAQKAAGAFALAMQELPQRMALAQAKTGDFANVQAQLSAEWEQAKVQIGQALLPALVELGNWVGRILPGAIRVLIAAGRDLKTAFSGIFDFLKPIFEPVVKVVKAVVDAFRGGGGISGAIGRLRADFEKLGPAAKIAVVALGGIAAAFAAITISAFPITSIILLGVALGEAYRRSATFRDVVKDIAKWITGSVVPAFERLGHALAPIAGVLVTGLVAAFHGVEAAVRFLIPVFQGVGRAVVSAFHQATPLVGEFGKTFKTIFQDLVPIVKPVAYVIGVVLVGSVKLAQKVWQHFGGTIITYTKEAFKLVVATIRNALESLRGVFDFFTGLLTLNWSKAWKGITEILGSAWHEIVQVFRAAGNVIVQFMTDLWHTVEKVVLKGVLYVVNLLGKIPTSISAFGVTIGFKNPFVGWSQTLQGMVDNIGKAGKAATQTATTVSDATKKAITSQTATQKQALTDLGNQTGKTVAQATSDGVTQGVTKTMPALASQISDAVQNAITAAHKAIVASVQSAKNNLDKIGQDLAKTISDIQAKIGGAAGAVAGSPQGAAFAKLKKLIEEGAPSFQIAKAQAELNGQLQNVGKTQKTQLQTQLGNLTALFDSGKIGYQQFEDRLHKILREDGLNMAQALRKVGPALADQLKAQIAALGKQARAIAAVPAKFRGIGGAGGAADIKIIQPLQVIHQEQQKVAVAEAKAQAAALKQAAKQTGYVQQMATVGVHVLPPKGTRGAGPAKPTVHVPVQIRPPAATTGAGASTRPRQPRVTPSHVAQAARTLSNALTDVCNDIIKSGKDIVAAELKVVTPIENLRRTELRIADDAAKQRASALREARTTNSLLRRLDRARGPLPGYGKEPKGTAGHHARKAAAAGVKA